MAFKAANGFGNRLKSAISGTTQADFAEQLGVSLSTFRYWLSEEKEPKIEALAKIADITGVSLNWLINGNDESHNDGSGTVFISRYAVYASAGTGSPVETELQKDPIAFDRDWLSHNIGISPDNLSIITASGDSMEPTIHDGALVMVNHTADRIMNDGIYALNIEHDLYVKRVQKNFDGTLIIRSDNNAYEAQTLTDNDVNNINVVGPVVWAGNQF